MKHVQKLLVERPYIQESGWRIGKSTFEEIDEFFKSGTSKRLEELRPSTLVAKVSANTHLLKILHEKGITEEFYSANAYSNACCAIKECEHTITSGKEAMQLKGVAKSSAKLVDKALLDLLKIVRNASKSSEAEEKEKQERLNREEKEKQERLVREEKEKQERLRREELEKKRKYEEDLRNRTERGEKFEFTPEQLHEIVNNTPEGQRLLQEKKRRLEEEASGVSREDSRIASLAEKVDEDLVVVETSSVGGEENT